MTTSESLADGIIEGMSIFGYSIEDIPVVTLSEEHWNNHTHSFASYSLVRTVIKLGQTASQLMEKQLMSPLTKETERIILNEYHESGEHAFSVSQQKETTKKMEKLRLLMLDTPQVEALMGLIKNFEARTGIQVETTVRQPITVP